MALVLAAGPLAADWLVFEDGTRRETAGPWRVVDDVVVYALPDGSFSAAHLHQVDLEASRAASGGVEPCVEIYPRPGFEAGLLGCVAAGMATERLRQDGDWTLIRFEDGTVGWSPDPPPAGPVPVRAGEPPQATVFAKPCLARSPVPGESEMELDCLPFGARVNRLDERGDWTLARSADGTIGWVPSPYLTREPMAAGILAASASSALRMFSPRPISPAILKTDDRVPADPEQPPLPTVRLGAKQETQPGTGPPDAPSSPSAPPAVRRIYPAVRVAAEPCLRRRSSAAGDSKTVDCMPDGTVVELLGRLNEWTQVRTDDGRRGWVLGEHLSPRYGSHLLLTDADVAHVPDDGRAAGVGGAEDALVEIEVDERGLEVGKWATSDEDPEGLMIVGMLRNMGTLVNTAVTLTVKVFDWEEKVVLEQPAAVDTTILMPGQGTRFQVKLPGVFAFRALAFDTSSVDFEVVDSELVSRI